MLGTDVFMIQALRFFGAICKNPLALVAQRQVHGCGDLLANRCMSFNLLPDRIYGRVRPQEPISKLLVFSQEPEQQMLGLYIRASELTRLVPGEKDDAPRFFRVTLK